MANMTLPVPECLSTQLENVAAVHRAHPRTFSIPRSVERRTLGRGQLVKLVFLVDDPASDQPRAERMWVKVRSATGRRYTGALASRPRYITNWQPGDVVDFLPQHVAAVYHPPSARQLPLDKLARVNPRVAADQAWPQRLLRTRPRGDFSGWWVFAPRQRFTALSDPSAFQLVPVADLINLYLVLDSVLDQPSGSAWRWDTAQAEYVPATV